MATNRYNLRSRIRDSKTPKTSYNIQTLPLEILEEILDKLDFTDLLQLRLTSTRCFNLVHGYSKFPTWLATKSVEFSLLEDVDNFNKSVFSLNFPHYQFDIPLNPSTVLATFVQNHSDKVVALCLGEMGSCFTTFESNFLDSLSSLKELYIRGFCRSPSPVVGERLIPIRCLGRLETFGFEYCRDSQNHPYSFLPYLKNLTKLGLGTVLSWCDQIEEGRLVMEFIRSRCAAMDASQTLEIKFTAEGTFASYSWLQTYRQQFVKEIALQAGKIKIHNFPSDKFTQFLPIRKQNEFFDQKELNEFLNHVKSFKDLIPKFLLVELRGMEKLELNLGLSFSEGMARLESPLCALREKLQWPKLKELEFSVREGDSGSCTRESVFNFLDIIFNQPRPSVTILNASLSLNETVREKYVTVIPKQLISTFPNLKRLTLDCDMFTHEDYNELITLLGRNTKISCLKLEIHVELNEEWFFGRDKSNPVVCQLKPANGRNRMTDSCFSDVLAVMPLRTFGLTDKSIVEVEDEESDQLEELPYSAEGFNALLNNTFGEKIRWFDFEIDCESDDLVPLALRESIDRVQERCELHCTYREPTVLEQNLFMKCFEFDD